MASLDDQKLAALKEIASSLKVISAPVDAQVQGYVNTIDNKIKLALEFLSKHLIDLINENDIKSMDDFKTDDLKNVFVAVFNTTDPAVFLKPTALIDTADEQESALAEADLNSEVFPVESMEGSVSETTTETEVDTEAVPAGETTEVEEETELNEEELDELNNAFAGRNSNVPTSSSFYS